MDRDPKPFADLRTISLAAVSIAAVITVMPNAAEACKPSDLRGRVRSVTETEFLVDSATGRIGEPRLADRIDASQDGSTIETTFYDPQSAEPTWKFITYVEGGRPVSGFRVVKGKTIPDTTCAYDGQGRLVEAKTGLNTREMSIVEKYEYGAGFIRRRTQVWRSSYVTTQTLDARGRVVKEVEFDEATSTIARTSEFTYGVDRKEQCTISHRDPRPRRDCFTTINDGHGNEIEVRAEVPIRKIVYEYDAVGNWVSRRLLVIGSRGPSIETIVQRKIEYW